MDYYYPNNQAPITTTPSDCGGGSGWIWGILFFLALLGVIGLTIWLVIVYRRDSKGKLINFTGQNIEVVSDTSVRGTWTATGNKSDTITIWATKTPPKFNSDGTVSNTDGEKPAEATNGATSVTLPGLKPRIKYFITLVASNSSTSNCQFYTQLVYMDSKTPVGVVANNTPANPDAVANTFAIEDILQIGKIQLQPTTSAEVGVTEVLFQQKPSSDRSLWVVNATGQIQSVEDTELCLFNNNGTLAAASCSADGSPATKTNSTWAYNPDSGALSNRWCLTNSTTSPMCMILNPITNGSASIRVATGSTSSDAWANAYEVA